MRKVIILLSILALSFALLPKPSNSSLCSDAEKQPGACFEIYKPVCAVYIAKGEVSRVDYSNRCLACKEETISFVLDGTCNTFPENASYCQPQKTKLGQQYFCPAVYQPVCGYYKSHIQCIRAPCAVTLSNSCYACQNSDIAYYVKGACENDLTL